MADRIELVFVTHSAYSTLCYKEILLCPKIRLLLPGNLSQTLNTADSFVFFSLRHVGSVDYSPGDTYLPVTLTCETDSDKVNERVEYSGQRSFVTGRLFVTYTHTYTQQSDCSIRSLKWSVTVINWRSVA